MPTTDPLRSDPPSPREHARSRRALLGGAVGAAAAFLVDAVSRARPAAAAAGDPIRMGRTNKAGGTNTILKTNVSGPAYHVVQDGSGPGVRAVSAKGHGALLTSRGSNRHAAFVQQKATSAGTGSGLKVDGGLNTGAILSTGNVNRYALEATNSAGGGVLRVEGVGASSVVVVSAASGVAVNAASESSYGVFGSSSSSRGVVGMSSSDIGVNGVAMSTGLIVSGVLGDAYSPVGDGVRGYNHSGTGSAANGVVGLTASQAGHGVLGWCLATGANSGVYGSASSSSGWGVYSNGNSHVQGNLTVSGSKSFQIDHPLDPANRYLRHHCAEGAEALTVYSGNVTLTESGEASVELPAWFQALNEDVRYQLTAVGHPMPSLHVKAAMAGNRFTIAGGVPGGDVSWQLTCRRRGMDDPIEIDKPADERGTYADPALHGQPESSSLQAVRTAELRNTLLRQE